jgi:hypothetical protein
VVSYDHLVHEASFFQQLGHLSWVHTAEIGMVGDNEPRQKLAQRSFVFFIGACKCQRIVSNCWLQGIFRSKLNNAFAYLLEQ